MVDLLLGQARFVVFNQCLQIRAGNRGSEDISILEVVEKVGSNGEEYGSSLALQKKLAMHEPSTYMDCFMF